MTGVFFVFFSFKCINTNTKCNIVLMPIAYALHLILLKMNGNILVTSKPVLFLYFFIYFYFFFIFLFFFFFLLPRCIRIFLCRNKLIPNENYFSLERCSYFVRPF